MATRKSPKANLRHTYGLLVEVGFVMALALLVLAFRLNIQPDTEITFEADPIDFPLIQEIQITTQPPKPPTPPRPQMIMEVPNDVVIEEEPLMLDYPIEIYDPVFVGDPPQIEEEEPVPQDEEPDIFIVVEQRPVLIGGLEEIQKKIAYPEIARKAGVEGRVIIQFVVDENGDIIRPEILKSIGGGCDEEALRVVREAKFTPGKQRGKAVKVRMSLPITFKLR